MWTDVGDKMSKPISGSKIFDALHEEKCIVMACNTRIVPGVVKGIMRAAKDTDSAVIFELARSECNLDGGYTGMTPKDYADKVMEVSDEVGHDVWALHADHIGIKKGDAADLEDTKKLIKAQIDAGFTMYAIDASHLFNFDGKTPEEELEPNIKATIEIAKFIKSEMGDKPFGLEVEVGEIGRKNDSGLILTTAKQATAFIKKLNEAGIEPNLLAIANGSTHGNIYDKDGKLIAQVSIDIERTKEIAKALADMGSRVRIAQHGITGTPIEFIRTRFPHGSILKGNVGTYWQNLVHDILKVYHPDLYANMKAWVLETYKEKSAGLKTDDQIMGKFGKFSTKQFYKELYSLPKNTVDAIEARAYADAMLFFEAFRAYGSGAKVR